MRGAQKKPPQKRRDSTGIVRFKTERGRFELPRPLRADRFSKPAHSTTLPPLRRSSETIAHASEAVKSLQARARYIGPVGPIATRLWQSSQLASPALHCSCCWFEVYCA